MLNQKQILEYAVKGLRSEIDKLEKDINIGKKYLSEYEKGGKPKTPKTPDEIKAIIQSKKAEIKKLDKERFDLEWKMTEMQ